jgi:tRNA threonylcarbamoyladenosine biosynthesis protein TsaE
MPQYLRLLSRSVTETEQLAKIISTILVAGDTLGLTGDLGAGKTAFTRGLCTGFGFTRAVTSPTFNLMHSYPTSPPLHHFDCFRMKRPQEMITTGFEELVGLRESILIVEWADVLKGYFDDWDFLIHLNFHSGQDDSRVITVSALEAPRFEELSLLLAQFHMEADLA